MNLFSISCTFHVDVKKLLIEYDTYRAKWEALALVEIAGELYWYKGMHNTPQLALVALDANVHAGIHLGKVGRQKAVINLSKETSISVEELF